MTTLDVIHSLRIGKKPVIPNHLAYHLYRCMHSPITRLLSSPKPTHVPILLPPAPNHKINNKQSWTTKSQPSQSPSALISQT